MWTGQMPSVVTFLGSLAYLQSACLSIHTSVCNIEAIRGGFLDLFLLRVISQISSALIWNKWTLLEYFCYVQQLRIVRVFEIVVHGVFTEYRGWVVRTCFLCSEGSVFETQLEDRAFWHWSTLPLPRIRCLDIVLK